MDYTRQRTQGSLNEVSKIYLRAFPVSCANRTWGPIGLLATSDPYFGKTKSTWDNVVRGYHKLRAKGQWIGSNDFRSYETERTQTGSSRFTTSPTPLTGYTCTAPNLLSQSEYSGQWLGYWCKVYSLFSGMNSPLTSEQQQSLIGEVNTSCLAKRGEGEANYIESLAELDKAYAMIAEHLVKMYTFVREFQGRRNYKLLQKLRRRQEKANAKNIGQYLAAGKQLGKKGNQYFSLLASEWLAFRYGLSPIISDIKAALKVIRTDFDKKPIVHTTRSKGSLNGSAHDNFGLTAGSLVYDITRQLTHLFSVQAVYHEEYVPTPYNKLGLTFKNAVGLGWELTHLSFVLDWFANVGDLIYANIPRIGVRSLGGSYFILETRYLVVAGGPISVTPAQVLNYTVSGSLSEVCVQKTATKRRFPELKAPTLVFKSDFRLDHFNRAADAVALIQQQLGRIRF